MVCTVIFMSNPTVVLCWGWGFDKNPTVVLCCVGVGVLTKVYLFLLCCLCLYCIAHLIKTIILLLTLVLLHVLTLWYVLHNISVHNTLIMILLHLQGVPGRALRKAIFKKMYEKWKKSKGGDQCRK